MKLIYPADVTPDTNGQWLVTFRDVPEAVTSGDSFEEACSRAGDALESALEFYAEAGENFPAASEPEKGEVLVQVVAPATTTRPA